MGLGGEDKTNGQQEINWLAETGPKKSEKEKKDELGMEKTMETRKLKDTGEDETMTIEIKQAVMKREMAKVEKSFNTQRK